MGKPKSWWRMKQIRHRDAVVLSGLSAALLLAGEFSGQVQSLYETYLAPAENQPVLFLLDLVLFVLAFTTYFGGLLVLFGGVHFLWGKVGRGRFLMSLGIGLGLLGFVRALAYYTLVNGSPTYYFTAYPSFIAFGLLFGIASYILMGEYALMLKKHARRVYRRWRRARRPAEVDDPEGGDSRRGGSRRGNGRRARTS